MDIVYHADTEFPLYCEVSEVEPLLDMVIIMKEGRILQMDDVDRIRSEHGIGLVEWMKDLFAVR
jgi:ABC-2 type transport system ATP-binding protein